MNPFILSADQRLDHWKEFRKSITALDDQEKLEQVVKYWSLAPLSKFSYDIEKPNTIPGPWEMVREGDWCKNSVAIGMEFTLRLAGISPERMTLALIKDYDISDQILILIIDQDKVLNYDYATISEYPTTKHDVIGRWRYSGKSYIELA